MNHEPLYYPLRPPKPENGYLPIAFDACISDGEGNCIILTKGRWLFGTRLKKAPEFTKNKGR